MSTSNPRFRSVWSALLSVFSMRIWLLSLASALPASQLTNVYLRHRLLRLAGVEVGSNCIIYPGIEITRGELKIHDSVFINSGCRFGCAGGIEIGSFTQIGPGVFFETVEHSRDFTQGEFRRSRAKRIILEKNVWIGARAVILPGVRIGKGAIVAAGAVVTKDVSPSSSVAGVPARQLQPNSNRGMN